MTYYLYMYSFPSQGILQLRIPNPMGEPRPVAAIRENTFFSPFRADSQRTTFMPVVNGSPLQFSCKRLASRTVINHLRSWETKVEHIWQITRVLQGQRQATYTLHHNRGINRFTIALGTDVVALADSAYQISIISEGVVSDFTAQHLEDIMAIGYVRSGQHQAFAAFKWMD
ncbi:hypothetical protein B0H13DRAFT_1868125 [Mycena leptocephala]|nr:hypothetical protein B0H13DRAFT_1868125 [Mycena leptocephala]